MKIYEVTEQKKRYISLLLLADEQENMIDRYLDSGTMSWMMMVLRQNVLLLMRRMV